MQELPSRADRGVFAGQGACWVPALLCAGVSWGGRRCSSPQVPSYARFVNTDQAKRSGPCPRDRAGARDTSAKVKPPAKQHH
jgi:hypothetical protein